MLQLFNMLEKHPHAMGRLKELVDRHPHAPPGDEGPPHPPWPLRKGLAAAEGRVESRKSTPACYRTAGRQAIPGWTRGGERDGEGAAGDTSALEPSTPLRHASLLSLQHTTQAMT